MHQRLHKTRSRRPALLYFDAPAMMEYQLPSRAQETVQCRREDKQKDCYEPLLDPEFVNVPMSHIKAEKSKIGEYSGRGIFAVQDIPKNSILAVDSTVKSFHVSPASVSAVENLMELAEERDLSLVESKVSAFYNFVEGMYHVSAAGIILDTSLRSCS